MPLLALLILSVALLGAVDHWRMREVHRSPGMLVAAEPVQHPLDTMAPFEHLGHALQPRARIALTARVLSGERYWVDRGSRLMPRDLALGWSSMSDTATLGQFRIQQRGRFYFYRPLMPLSADDMMVAARSSANMHLIPATRAIRRAILRARVGQLVEIEGVLVDVRGPDGWQLRTSMTRDDTGAGACEIIFVEHFAVR